MSDKPYTIKCWKLLGPLTSDDIEWMNNSKLDVSLGVGLGSSWVDMNTGTQIIDPSSRASIFTYTEQEETWLLLRYADRLTLDVLINGIKL